MTYVLILAVWLFWALGYDSLFNWSLLALSILLFLELNVYIRKRIKKVPFISIGFLFVFGYYLVHFQLFLWKVFGKTEIQKVVFEFLYVSDDIMKRAALISIIGLFSFVKGYKCVNWKKVNHNALNIRMANSVLLLPAIIVFLVFFFSNPDYLRGTYNLLSWSSLTKYSYTLFITLYLAGLSYRIYTIRSRNYDGFIGYVKEIGLGWTTLTLVYTLLSVFIGDRGPIISNTLLFLSIYLLRLQKVSLVKSVFTLALSMLILVGVKSLRTRSYKSLGSRFDSFSLSSKEGEKLGVESNVLTLPLELGLSARCLHHAIDYTDENGFFYGYFQARQIVASIPFAGSLFGLIVNGNQEELLSSSWLLSHKIQGGDIRYGDGTTAVADLYLDFGLVGVLIGFFLFGLAIGNFDLLLKNSSGQVPYWLYALAITYFSTSFYLGRSTVLIMLQRVTPVILLVYIFWNIFRQNNEYFENER